MNLADVFTVGLIVLGLLAVFVGIWLATAGLFPVRLERCADRLGATPWRCGLVGLATAVPLIVAGGAVGRVAPNAPGKLLGVALILATVLAALAGTAALALRIGRGLAAEGDAREPWRRVRRGGVAGADPRDDRAAAGNAVGGSGRDGADGAGRTGRGRGREGRWRGEGHKRERGVTCT